MKYSIILLGLTLLGVAACETVVDIDVPQEAPRLVVTSFIGVDGPVWVSLSQSKSALSSAPIRGVSGAQISLLEDGQPVATLQEVIVPDSISRDRIDFITSYRSEYVPSAGKEYTLQISKEGFEPVEATATVTPPIPIANLQYDTTVVTFYDYNPVTDSSTITQQPVLDRVRLTIDDPAEEMNFYEILVLYYRTDYRYEIDDNGNYTVVDSSRYLSSPQLISEDPVVDDGDNFLEGDDYYYWWGNSSFMFSDEIFNGRRYTFNFNINRDRGFNIANNHGFSSSQEEASEYFITLRTLSEAQYRHMLSVDLQRETDGNPFAEPVPIYSNIQGGYGIFVGYSADVDTVSLE